MNTNWTRCLIFARRLAGPSACSLSGQEAVQPGQSGGRALVEPNGLCPASVGSVVLTSWMEGKFSVPVWRAVGRGRSRVDRWPIIRLEPDESPLLKRAIPEAAARLDSRAYRARR